jgi:hypothetical protein
LVIVTTLVCSMVVSAVGAPPRGCTGSVSLGTFRLSVRRPHDSVSLPIKEASIIPAGATLEWEPVHLSPQISGKSEVAALVAPAPSGPLAVLAPKKLNAHQEWQLPAAPAVIALVLGPQGLSMSKVKSLVARNEDLLTQLADYAEQTSEVEALVQQLANSEQSGGTADAALRGFSTQWGVALPKLDSKAPTDQQASTLLTALLPSAHTYDPLASSSMQLQQSAGLAASVAGLFFGNTVGLAAGGTALYENLKAVMFPSTEFRSSFAQNTDARSMAFCTKAEAAKSRTRIAYLWAYRVPNLHLPVAALAATASLPLGAKSELTVRLAEGSSIKQLLAAHDWRLEPLPNGSSVAVNVAPGSTPDSLEIDLTKTKLAAGEYRLAATWDWEPVTFGTLYLRPFADFASVRLCPGERDRLVEGRGTVTVKLTGADFEFVRKAAVQKVAARPTAGTETAFDVPAAHNGAPRNTLNVDIDTAAAGRYRLLLAQSDGVNHPIPITVLPPDPKISNLPVRVNIGETKEAVHLIGTGLDRVESLSTDAGAISGSAANGEWTGEIQPRAGLQAGARFALSFRVKGHDDPITVPDALEIVGPRPRIASIRKSIPGDLGIDLRDDELPAGTVVGLVIQVDHLHDGASRPRVEVACRTGDLRKALAVSAGEPAGAASLSFAGSGGLYLSLDPGAVGYAGCELALTVRLEPEGPSDPALVGRIVRIPRIAEFTLTNEAAGPNQYSGILRGRDLDVVERVGWDAQHGTPVEAIPTPVPGEAAEQTLRVALPWPAPAPHAPLYVWLRGEDAGRKTAVVY